MKKSFAIALGIAIFSSSLTAPTETMSLYTENISLYSKIQSSAPQSSPSDSIETKEVVDGKLTLEFIRQISSWESFEHITFPISGVCEYNNIKSNEVEDFSCIMLIKCLNKRFTLPLYHDEEYISYVLDGIPLKQIDFTRLMQKYQEIINIYNTSNDLQIIFEPRILNEDYMQVTIESTNVIDLEQSITHLGQKAILKNGAIYWESAFNDGSGKYGVATDTNQYVTVNGFAYFSDENRTTISESYYAPYDEIGEEECYIIKPWEFRMLHICTETTDFGWVYAEDVFRID